MSLSEQLTFELKQADNHLRAALAFAATSERSNVLTSISELINKLDMIESHDSMMDTLDDVIKECEDKRKTDHDL